MKRYGLFHQNSNEPINSIKSVSLDGAIIFFAAQKRLDLEKFNALFDDLLKTQLVLKGVMTIEDWEEIKQKVEYEYAQDQYFQEMKQAENIRNRIDVLNQMAPYVGTYFSKEYVRKSVLRFSDDDIDRIEKENEDDPVEVQPQDQPGSDQAAALSRENVR